MINPFRRLMYEMFVQPIINVAYDVIDLTKDAYHRLPLHSRRARQRRPHLWRWENLPPHEPRST
jgi:hypothetical protein